MGRYHPGELGAQERAGVLVDAARLGGIIRSDIPLAAARFLEERALLFVTGQDADGRLWASPLAGPPGFAAAEDDQTIIIEAELPAVDPLAGAFAGPADCGLLAVDFGRRRRMRVNGTAVAESGRLVARTQQVFANCPRYIHRRVRTDGPAAAGGASPARRSPSGSVLTAGQRAWITNADTVIVGSHAPGYGADCSHRGGAPGFIEVTEPASLRWPDYPGNNMFATLGNFELDPAAALLFIDWEHSHTLQLTGQARTVATGPAHSVEFAIDEIIETRNRLPYTWTRIPGDDHEDRLTAARLAPD